MEENPPPGKNPRKRSYTMVSNTTPSQTHAPARLPEDILAFLQEMSQYTTQKKEEMGLENFRILVVTDLLFQAAHERNVELFDSRFPNIRIAGNPDNNTIKRGLIGKTLHDCLTPVTLPRRGVPIPEKTVFEKYEDLITSQPLTSQQSDVSTLVDSQNSTSSEDTAPSQLRRTDGPHPLFSGTSSAERAELPIAQAVVPEIRLPEMRVIGSERLEHLALARVRIPGSSLYTLKVVSEIPSTTVNTAEREPSSPGENRSSSNSRSSSPNRG